MQFLDPEFCTHWIPLGASQPPTSLVFLLSFVVAEVQDPPGTQQWWLTIASCQVARVLSHPESSRRSTPPSTPYFVLKK